MPLKHELADFVGRAIVMLDGVRVRFGETVAKLHALTLLADYASDDAAKVLVGEARTAVQEALDSFDRTSWKTEDLDAIVAPVEVVKP